MVLVIKLSIKAFYVVSKSEKSGKEKTWRMLIRNEKVILGILLASINRSLFIALMMKVE